MKYYQSLLIIILFGSFAYANSLGNGFVWDDEEQIVKNTVIQHLANIRAIASGATFTTGGAGLSGWFFRPLLTLSFMLNFAIWGGQAFGYHLFQIVFHLANAVLLFFILERLGSKRAIHTLLATIFAVHPAITEAVVYISAVGEVMYSFFVLLSLLLLLRAKKLTIGRLLGVCFLLLAAMLFKESAIAAFPIIALTILLYQKRFVPSVTLGLAVTIFLYGTIRLGLVGTPIRPPQFAPISEASVGDRLLTMPQSLLSYLRLIVFPKDLAISRHFVVKGASLTDFYLPLVAVIIVATATVFLIYVRKSRRMMLGTAWFLSGYMVISNIFPLDMTIAERWLYFPTIGIIVYLAGLLDTLPRRAMPYILVCLALTVVPLALRTIARNSNWKNGLTLYSHDSTISKDSFDLENNLGVELFRIGRYDEAKIRFERSIALQPAWYFAYNNLGAVYERQSNVQKAKSLYLQTLGISDYYIAFENAAALMLREGDLAQARAFTERAVTKLPGNTNLWLILAQTYAKLGERDKAYSAAHHALPYGGIVTK